MFGRKPATLLATVVALSFPLQAMAETGPGQTTAAAPAKLLFAQYDGSPFGTPPGSFSPYDGYGAPPGFAGPSGGPGFGRYDGGYDQRGSRSAAASVRHLTYHGFRIDLTAGAASPNLAGEVASIEHQIDIVDSVGLSQSDLRLFRRFPIRISNGLTGGGHYNGGSNVIMGNLLISDNRPVLLHEYMHVLHHARFPGGFQNPDIRSFYEQAVAGNLYEEGSYMLSNPGEFFAVTASCYLYGTVARPPYNRDTIRTQQPGYYAYLERLFGRAGVSRSSSGQGGAPSRFQAHVPASSHAAATSAS